MASSLVDGVIPSTGSGQALSVDVLQAERRACPEPDGEGISATTLRATGDPSLRLKSGYAQDDKVVRAKLSHYRKQGGIDEIHLFGIHRAGKIRRDDRGRATRNVRRM